MDAQAKREYIWTATARTLLFEVLVARFGPYEKWEQANRPGRGLNEAYVKFSEDFADLVGANSGEAVRNQINWAIPTLRTANVWEPSHSRYAILNMAAAFDAGFITSAHFPTLIAKRGRGSKRLHELRAA